MAENGYTRAVCFSCGHASQELKRAGVEVLDISPRGDLQALRWFTPAEISRAFPGAFDATSGHLPLALMYRIADRLRSLLAFQPGQRVSVPSGSGETLLCLALAFPFVRFVAVYDNSNPATEWNEGAQLNRLVELVAQGGIVRISPDKAD